MYKKILSLTLLAFVSISYAAPKVDTALRCKRVGVGADFGDSHLIIIYADKSGVDAYLDYTDGVFGINNLKNRMTNQSSYDFDLIKVMPKGEPTDSKATVTINKNSLEMIVYTTSPQFNVSYNFACTKVDSGEGLKDFEGYSSKKRNSLNK
jgi:hypothetical protein